ncbi:MAG: DoxX family protein [Candidatus Taylorbacteria bacterium]|nr:DoxX family protein [Candidatus Taylorbacteria bacterium]
MRNIAPIILRIGISLVIIWFGAQQLLDASLWVSYLPDWAHALPVSQIGLVHINGWFEVLAGLSLLAGFYTRIAAFLIALHLLEITYTVGYGQIGVRDFGLTIALISVFFYGADKWSLDRLFDGSILRSNIHTP